MCITVLALVLLGCRRRAVSKPTGIRHHQNVSSVLWYTFEPPAVYAKQSELVYNLNHGILEAPPRENSDIHDALEFLLKYASMAASTSLMVRLGGMMVKCIP